MMTSITCTAPADDLEAAAEAARIFGEAMEDDSSSVYFCPKNRRVLWQSYVTEHFQATRDNQQLYRVVGREAAAICFLYPQQMAHSWSVTFGGVFTLLRHTPLLRLWKWISIGSLFDRQKADFHKVHGDFWYILLIGVTKKDQGKGLGTALLRRMLEDADARGLVTYLEATHPDNRRLYERMGFVALKSVLPFPGEEITLMSRPAKGAAAPAP